MVRARRLDLSRSMSDTPLFRWTHIFPLLFPTFPMAAFAFAFYPT